MRIIDKNTDFYDFYQNIYRDNNLTFDRTDSFILSKEDLSKAFYYDDYMYSHLRKDRKRFSFILLQVGHTFWLLMSEILEVDTYDNPTKYNLELLTKWKNYDIPRQKIALNIIRFPYRIVSSYNTKEKIYEKIPTIMQAVNNNEYEVYRDLCQYRFYRGDWNCNGSTQYEIRHIPILKESGLASHIDPLDIYLAFEEFFSLEKTDSERRESKGLTDREKVENHGFDKRTSFRNM